jgi:TonB family protein
MIADAMANLFVSFPANDLLSVIERRMDLPTREEVAHGGSEHVETVGVTGSNPVSRTIFHSRMNLRAAAANGLLLALVLLGPPMSCVRGQNIRTDSDAGGYGIVSDSTTQKPAAVFSPTPAYPFEARLKRWIGQGEVKLEIDPVTGNVRDAAIVKSTGHDILDDAALFAFRHWRFEPGCTAVKLPVIFELTKPARSTGIKVAKTRAAVVSPVPQYGPDWPSGSGLLLLHVNRSTGDVVSVEVAKSTGHKILDDSAANAFKKWRFKPGTYREIKVPITFTHERQKS